MASRLIKFVGRMRERKSSFFVSRLMMRLKFDPMRLEVPDSDENILAIVEACRGLGYDVPLEDRP
jgi:hypothetical protein